ncbi:MAG: hypothetical protein K8H87_10050 [Pseudorhodoplanes sp.]|nr:hypothetical protein [Pseudorhodoplanes sp.]
MMKPLPCRWGHHFHKAFEPPLIGISCFEDKASKDRYEYNIKIADKTNKGFEYCL